MGLRSVKHINVYLTNKDRKDIVTKIYSLPLFFFPSQDPFTLLKSIDFSEEFLFMWIIPVDVHCT